MPGARFVWFARFGPGPGSADTPSSAPTHAVSDRCLMLMVFDQGEQIAPTRRLNAKTPRSRPDAFGHVGALEGIT